MPLPISAARILPHRETMLLLDEVAECRDGFARCVARIGPDHPFVNGRGELEPVALVEILSQAAAALRGCEGSGQDEAPRIGYLAGIKEFEVHRRPRSGDVLNVEIRQTVMLGSVAMMEGRILIGDDCISSGTLKVWEESDGVSPRTPEVPGSAVEESGDVDFDERLDDRDSPMRRALLRSLVRTELSEAEDRAIGEFRFAPSFLGFRGHFPGFPILPGVVMIQSALIVCERLLECSLRLSEVERAKFSGQVHPGHSVQTEVRLKPDGGRWKIRVNLTRGEDRVADLRMIVAADEPCS